LGRNPDAYADAVILCRMAKATGTRKTVLCALVEIAMYGGICDLVQRGVDMGSWSEPQLTGFRDFFASETCWQDFENGLHSERVVHIETWDASKPLGVGVKDPTGWVWTRLLAPLRPGLIAEARLRAERAESAIIDCYDPMGDRFDLARAQKLMAQPLTWCERLNPYSEFERLAWRNINPVAITDAKRHFLVEMYGVAVAIELFQIGHQSYPAKLDELVPAYLPRIPRSLLTGEPPAYTRIDPAHFRLSSAHWHEEAETPELVWPPLERNSH